MPRVGRTSAVVPLNPEQNPTGAPQPPERFTPAMPTTAEELMAAWELPPEAWERTTVKTTRFIRGTQQMELLSSCPLPEWSLDDMARTYGPGTYRIQAGPGPYRTKNTTVTVSREYADAAGFAAAPQYIPAPSPIEQQAARTFQQATQAGVDPVSLAAMIQTAVDNALQRVNPRKDEGSSLDLILKGFELANNLTTRSMETAKNMLGMGAGAAEPTPTSWAEVALQLGPTLLGTLQTAIMQSRQTPPPAPAPAAAPAPAPQRPTLPPPAEGAHAMPGHPAFPPAPAEAAPILNIMRNYGPVLRGHLESETHPNELAAQLSGLIGPDLDPAILAAADHAKEHGPEFLGNAAPYLATPKAAAVLIAWAELIRQEQGE